MPRQLNTALVEWGLFVKGPHVLRAHAKSLRGRQALVVHLISSLSASAHISRARPPATRFFAPAPLRGAALPGRPDWPLEPLVVGGPIA